MAPYQTFVEKYTGLPINALIRGLGGMFGRSAAASERQGPYVPDRIRNAPTPLPLPPAPTGVAPGMGTTTIVRGDDDQYRQLLSQYGSLAKAGKQEEAEKLGMEIWEKKYGKTPMGQPGGAVGSHNPLMQSTFGYQAGQGPAATSKAFNLPQGFDVSQNFSVAANAVPAPWHTQGQAVSAPYQEAMDKAFEKTNPMNLMSQQQPGLPEDVGEKVRSFLTGKGQFMYNKQD